MIQKHTGNTTDKGLKSTATEAQQTVWQGDRQVYVGL